MNFKSGLLVLILCILLVLFFGLFKQEIYIWKIQYAPEVATIPKITKYSCPQQYLNPANEKWKADLQAQENRFKIECKEIVPTEKEPPFVPGESLSEMIKQNRIEDEKVEKCVKDKMSEITKSPPPPIYLEKQCECKNVVVEEQKVTWREIKKR